MELISLLIALVVIGAFLYLVNLIRMDATVKQIVWVVAIVAIVIWLTRALAPALRL